MSTVKTLSRHLSQLNPLNEKGRIAAGKIGLTLDNMTNRSAASNRFAEIYGSGWTTKLLEATMRASFLKPWTDGGRKAFGMEFSSKLADNFSKQFDDLHWATKRGFESYGITKEDWDIFRKTELLDLDDGHFYANLTEDSAKKFHQMAMSETEFAVPTPDARVRAFTTGGGKERGSNTGQAWRSAFFLQSFPITIATTHHYRIAAQASNMDKIGYAGALLATTTVLGNMSLAAKDIASGREPRTFNFDDPLSEHNLKLLLDSMIQGGSLSILGDFLASDKNRYGYDTIGSAPYDFLTEVAKLTVGNAQQLAAGEDTNFLGESVRMGRKYHPDIWQTKLFTDSMFNWLERMADPEAEGRQNRVVNKRFDDFGQSYIMRPDETILDKLN
jgi:hypothetical protein